MQGDSKLVLNQVFGVWKVSAPHLAAQRDRARALLQRIPQHTWEHVPRDANAAADRLANRAIASALAAEPPLEQDVPSPDKRTASAASPDGSALTAQQLALIEQKREQALLKRRRMHGSPAESDASPARLLLAPSPPIAPSVALLTEAPQLHSPSPVPAPSASALVEQTPATQMGPRGSTPALASTLDRVPATLAEASQPGTGARLSTGVQCSLPLEAPAQTEAAAPVLRFCFACGARLVVPAQCFCHTCGAALALPASTLL